jgi:hypothetical protein
MTVDEEPMRLRTRLEELVGMSGADYLMDRPAGGWSDLVTTQTLDLRLAAFEAKMDLRFAEVERRFDAVDHRFDRFEHQLLAQVDRRLRAQSWVTISTIIAAVGVMAAALRL